MIVMRRDTFKLLQTMTGDDPTSPGSWTIPADMLPWLERETETASLISVAAVRITDGTDITNTSVRPYGAPSGTESSLVCEHPDPGAADEYKEWLLAQATQAAKIGRQSRQSKTNDESPAPSPAPPARGADLGGGGAAA